MLFYKLKDPQRKLRPIFWTQNHLQFSI